MPNRSVLDLRGRVLVGVIVLVAVNTAILATMISTASDNLTTMRGKGKELEIREQCIRELDNCWIINGFGIPYGTVRSQCHFPQGKVLE